MAEIRWSLAAERDLRLIEEFIARDSPLRAITLIDLPWLPDRYLHQPSELTILRVVQGARDFASLVEREPCDLR